MTPLSEPRPAGRGTLPTMYSKPTAYLLTWTRYGTWLPGDRRGSINKHAAQPFTPITAPNTHQEHHALRLLKRPPLVFNCVQRRVVEQAIEQHCLHRDWIVHAVNVRTNHVHAVVGASTHRPERVMNELKAWATRALRTVDQAPAEGRVWTRHGSTRYLWNEESVQRAIVYVRDLQAEPPPFRSGL